MLVSTQQDCAESSLNGVINSNFSCDENKINSSINRLKQGFKNNKNINDKICVYEDDFKPRQLTKDEKRHILNITLKLGNSAICSDNICNNENFIHSYSLKYIVIESSIFKKHYKRNLFERRVV